jgi:hypothetical protein
MHEELTRVYDLLVSTASVLLPGPNGTLQPIFGGIATHTPSNDDYYRLDVHRLSTVTVNLEWYNLIGRLYVEVETSDPQNVGPSAMTLTRSEAGGTAVLLGLLAPGYCRVHIPGPLERELDILPKWWGDPGPLVVRALEQYYAVTVGEDRGDGPAIVFERPDAAVRVQLLDIEGSLVCEAEPGETSLRVDTSAIQPGTYLLRVAREEGTGQVALQMMPPV